MLVAVSCTYSASPLLFEYASEVSFPIPEDVVGATMSFSFNLVGMLYLLFFLNKRLGQSGVDGSGWSGLRRERLGFSLC